MKSFKCKVGLCMTELWAISAFRGGTKKIPANKTEEESLAKGKPGERGFLQATRTKYVRREGTIHPLRSEA